MDEANRPPDITVTLVKHVEKVDPGIELNAKAQEGMTLMQAQKFPEARKIFEDLLAKFPDVHQLNAYIAQTYAGENNIPKAVEYMKTASDKDPANAEMRLVLADLMMEGGDKPAALDDHERRSTSPRSRTRCPSSTPRSRSSTTTRPTRRSPC